MHTKRNFSFRAHKAVLFSFICIVSFLIPGCKISQHMLAAGKDMFTAVTLSEKEAKALGSKAAAEYDRRHMMAAASSTYAQRLQHIITKLPRKDTQQFNFNVYQTSEINAFALPDGSIRIYSGLMDLMSDDEVLFVIGHEMGHVKNKDSLERLRLAYTTAAARKGIASAGGIAEQLSASQLGTLAESVIHAQYSQSQELAADEAGFLLLRTANIDTKHAITALRKLGTGKNNKNSLLSSHPDAQKRAQRLEQMR